MNSYFSFQGLQLHFTDTKTSNPPVILCHANGYSEGCYNFYKARLEERFRVISFDFAGHGRSQKSLDYKDWNFFRDQLITLLDLLELKDAVVLGHSLGGAVSLLASLERPERIRKVLALDPVILGWRTVLLSKFLNNPLATGAIGRRREFESIALVRKLYKRLPVFSKFHPEVYEDYLNSCFRQIPDSEKVELCCSPEVEAKTFGMAHFYILKQFWRVKQETHILLPKPWGVCSPSLAKKITKRNSNSSITVVPGFTHFFPFEEPEKTWRWILEKI